jgi:hypothetical protein
MTLIKHRIQTLTLREFASFPSQVASAKDMIKEWRRESRPKFRLVSSGRSAADISSDSLPDDPDDGLPLEGR